jgi:predicted nucleic acid-binding protein
MSDEGLICFIDTNVWLYAFVAAQDETKSARARRLLQEVGDAAVVSTQVINEVCVNLLRKAAFAEETLRQLVASYYAVYPVVVISREIQIAASRLRDRHSLSFWDSLIVASALKGGATVLYSEDLAHGLVIEEHLKVVNPFSSPMP